MKIKCLITSLIVFVTLHVFAQEASVTDDDLRKYAVAMDSINDMKKELLTELSTMVKNNEAMTNARYNELSKIIDNEEQLKQAKATPEEINFVKEVQAKKDDGTEEITETFQTMARDYIGVEKFNQIKSALESDPSVKSRYETILKEVEKGG